MPIKQLLVLVPVLALAAAAPGCNAGDGAEANLDVEIAALSAADVVGVHVTVTGPGMTALGVDLVKAGNVYRGTLGGIPAGNDRVFTGDATDGSGAVVFHGASAPVTISTAPTTDGTYPLTLRVTDPEGAFDTVSITIQVSAAAATGAADVTASVNTAPQVVSIAATRLVPGDIVPVTLSVFDPDGDQLAFAWSTDCGAHFSGNNNLVQSPGIFFFAFETPAVTACTLRVDVSDGHGGSNVGTLVVPVGPPPSANFAPVVDTTFQSASTADHGGSVILRAAAHDPEGSPVTFAWTASQGTITGEQDESGSSQVTWQAAACFIGTATVTLEVTDDVGNRTTTTFTISAIAANCAPPGVIAWWGADGTPGDSIGGRATFSFTGSYTAGVHGQAFLFDGTQSLHADSAGLPLGSADRTLELWVRVDVRSPGESLLGGYGAFGTGNAAYELGDLSDDTCFFSAWGPGISGGTLAADGQFHHVAVTNVGTAVSLYIDGVLASSGVVPLATQPGDLVLGALDSFRHLTGAVDEVRIYNRALSAAEIANIAAGNTY